MAIYISLLLILILFLNYKNDKIIFYYAISFLFVFFAIKNLNIGTDTATYFDHFTDLLNGDRHYKTEPIWPLIANICIFFNINFSLFQILFYALTIIPIAYVIQKESKNYLLSVFFYYSFFYYLNSFSITRQSLAMAFLFICFYFIKNRKLLLAILFLLLAMLTHNLAILGILAFIFYFKQFSKKSIFILLVVSFFAGLFLNKQMLFFLPQKYQGFFDWPGHGFRENQLPYTVIIIAINSVFMFCLLTDSKKTSTPNFWAQTLLIGLLLMNVTQRLVLGLRLTQFYMFTQIIFYANYIEERQTYKKLYTFGLILYASTYFLGLLARDSIGICPYEITPLISHLFGF